MPAHLSGLTLSERNMKNPRQSLFASFVLIFSILHRASFCQGFEPSFREPVSVVPESRTPATESPYILNPLPAPRVESLLIRVLQKIFRKQFPYTDVIISPQIASSDCEDSLRNGTMCRTISYGNGSRKTLTMDHSLEAAVYRTRLLIRDYDIQGNETRTKAILGKYNHEGAAPHVVERFDIISWPERGPATREWIIAEFSRDSDIRRLIWAKYLQKGSGLTAEISDYAVLDYDECGVPMRGTIKKWKNGKAVQTSLPSSTSSFGARDLERQMLRKVSAALGS